MPNRGETQPTRQLLPSVIILSLILATIAIAPAQSSGQGSGLTAEQRADALLKQMKVEEKVGQVNQAAGGLFSDGPPAEEMVRKGQAGSVLWLADSAAINRMQKIAKEESRLHIPLLIGLDVIHGYHTIFPPPLGMSATWDPKLVEQAQIIAGYSTRTCLRRRQRPTRNSRRATRT